MFKNYIQRHNSSKIFWIGLIIFFSLNLFSAFTMGVHYDEAYYWLYSKELAFGYFDHPPMVAWLIFLGQLLFKGTIGLRLLTILISSTSIYILWLLCKPFGKNAILFWALIYSILLIHPYTLVATPDAPLFFFTVLFFYTYKHFIKNTDWLSPVLFALVTSLLIYSKYHAVLVVGFTVLSNLELITKKRTWIYGLFVLIFLTPHLFWLYNNNFAPFQYHLLDSHGSVYKPTITISYLLNLLLLAGPWLGWLFIYVLIINKPEDLNQKALKYVGLGTIIFFLTSTINGDFEAHWTLISMIPLVIISYKHFYISKKWKKWIYASGILNFALLCTARVLMIVPAGDHIKIASMYRGWDTDTQMLKEATNGKPIIFQDRWNKAARFAWYANDNSVTNINSALYRKNQFDIWNRDEDLTGQTVCVVTLDSTQFTNAQKIETNKSKWYFKTISNFHSYYDLKLNMNSCWYENGKLYTEIEIQNPYNYDVIINDDKTVGYFQLNKAEVSEWKLLKENQITSLKLSANSSQIIKINFVISKKEFSNNDIYIMLKINELKPIPSKIHLKYDSIK